ncbi:MAG TPA: TetR family transcriptional regulator [Myxococcota bacterium]|jgi:AcrR family transcriptional regulator
METAKRECILIEAAKAFARFGFQKASVDDIAKSAGVAKGTIYLAAPSKRDLFYEVLLREVRAWNAELMKRIDPRKNADEILIEISWDSMQTLDERPLVRDLLLGHHTELLPEIADKIDELRRIGTEPVAEVLRLGVRQKRFRTELDVDEVARVLLDLHIATMMFYGKAAPDQLARRSAAGFDLILRGLLVGDVDARTLTTAA